MTQAQYARHVGISRQAVSAQIKKGQIPVGPDGLINPVAADQARAMLVEPARSALKHKPSADAAPVNTHSGDEASGDSVNQEDEPENPENTQAMRGAQLSSHAKAAHYSIQAQLKKLDLEERMGTLVKAEEVSAILGDVFRELRDQLLALPSRVKGPLVMMNDETVIQAYLTEQLRLMLDHAAQQAADKSNALR